MVKAVAGLSARIWHGTFDRKSKGGVMSTDTRLGFTREGWQGRSRSSALHNCHLAGCLRMRRRTWKQHGRRARAGCSHRGLKSSCQGCQCRGPDQLMPPHGTGSKGAITPTSLCASGWALRWSCHLMLIHMGLCFIEPLAAIRGAVLSL